MTEMLERMAYASWLYEERFLRMWSGPSYYDEEDHLDEDMLRKKWDDQPNAAPYQKAYHFAKMRALLETMRKPTDEMLDAAMDKLGLETPRWRADQARVYEAMIDSILGTAGRASDG